jgi:hypothetical protein
MKNEVMQMVKRCGFGLRRVVLVVSGAFASGSVMAAGEPATYDFSAITGAVSWTEVTAAVLALYAGVAVLIVSAAGGKFLLKKVGLI